MSTVVMFYYTSKLSKCEGLTTFNKFLTAKTILVSFQCVGNSDSSEFCVGSSWNFDFMSCLLMLCKTVNVLQHICDLSTSLSLTHTHIHITALFQGLPGSAGTRKAKPI